MKRVLVIKALGAGLTHYLRYEKGEKPDPKTSNVPNGPGKKKVTGKEGEVESLLPRGHECGFEPQTIEKGRRRFGVKIMSM